MGSTTNEPRAHRGDSIMSVAFQTLEDRGRELVSEDYILWLIALIGRLLRQIRD